MRETSDNIGKAAVGINEVNHNVTQGSTVSGNIAREIAEISQVEEGINKDSSIIKSQSNELTNLAGLLNKIAVQFKVG